jgi:cobalamin biosynthesis protein CobW
MRTPVLIVSGFLGSGKTTLVRSVLEQSQAAGIRTAVISNEFGALGIDEALLRGSPGDLVELAGGCVCCKLSDALVETLQRLHETINPDRIVIETSGVALPFETQLHLYRPAVRDWIGEDACVVVVDATGSAFESFEDADGEATPNETFEQQVQSADLLVLSKTDLADPTAMAARLAVLCPGTPVLEAVHGNIPVEVLLPGSSAFEAAPTERARPEHAGAHSHEAFETESLLIPEGTPEDQIEAQLRTLHALRVKGFVQTADGVRVVQGVGRRIEFLHPGPVPVDRALLGRIVVIRRGHGSHRHEGAHGVPDSDCPQ